MNVNPVARFIFWLFFISLTLIGVASAQEVGKPFEGVASICVTKEEAVAIVTTEKVEGEAKATEKFVASETCNNVPLYFLVNRVVATVKTERGTWSVVEIYVPVRDEVAVVYWLTRLTIHGYKEV